MCAVAVTGGHVSRALDFYDKVGKYIALGGTMSWEDEDNPDVPDPEDFRLRDLVGLKKVDNTFLVVPDNEKGTISYRDQKWRIVPRDFKTRIVGTSGVPQGTKVLNLESLAGISEGTKLRINEYYEGKVISISGSLVTIDTEAPIDIPSGSFVTGGAVVEDAKYVYIEAYFNYDRFPLVSYRQIGLYTGVLPDTLDTILAGSYSSTGYDEYTNLGILEVLDNRAKLTRSSEMRELVSFVIEF